MYENKFKMTQEQNIFFAKRNIVDYIYKSARLEGLNVTYPETYAIYEQAALKNVNIDSVQIILNLKHAWQKIFNRINDNLNLSFIKTIHSEVARGEALSWGELRSGEIGIGGTSYIPPIPNEAEVESELKIFLKIEKPAERAIEIMLWGMKKQLFWDGNKRTSMLIANKIMIENGCGIISISPENLEEFHIKLSDYYTNDMLEQMKQFVYNKCSVGTNFNNIKEQTIKTFER